MKNTLRADAQAEKKELLGSYLGGYIAASRKLKQLKQKELAKKLGVDASTVCRWEKGEALPPHDVLRKIARVLDLDEEKTLSIARLSVYPRAVPEEERPVAKVLNPLTEAEMIEYGVIEVPSPKSVKRGGKSHDNDYVEIIIIRKKASEELDKLIAGFMKAVSSNKKTAPPAPRKQPAKRAVGAK